MITLLIVFYRQCLRVKFAEMLIKYCDRIQFLRYAFVFTDYCPYVVQCISQIKYFERLVISMIILEKLIVFSKVMANTIGRPYGNICTWQKYCAMIFFLICVGYLFLDRLIYPRNCSCCNCNSVPAVNCIDRKD